MTIYWLLLILIVIPAIEIAIFIWSGSMIGIWSVLFIIVLTGFIGAFLVRQEGIKTWYRLQQSMQHGTRPSEEILDGICIIIAGIFLVTPGFFTDLLGFLLVVPITRKPFKWLFMTLLIKKMKNGTVVYRRW